MEALRQTGFLDRSARTTDQDRPYTVYVPRGWNGDPLPAILFLHGSGESGTDGIKQTAIGLGNAIRFEAKRWPFLAVFPQKCDTRSMWIDDEPMLQAILAGVDKEFPTDPERRYLTGLSQGGRGTFQLATKLRWKFAAVAPVCGWAEVGEVQHLIQMPLWAFHGEKDNVVPPNKTREPVEWLIAQGAPAKLTMYPDLSHNSWDAAYGQSGLWDWFLQHTLK